MIQSLNTCSIEERIDQLCASESDRHIARDYLLKGQFMGELICRACATLQQWLYWFAQKNSLR